MRLWPLLLCPPYAHHGAHQKCGERDLEDNHADADPDLMRLIMESDDVFGASSDPVLDRWKKPL